jgi:hypothetical protein
VTEDKLMKDELTRSTLLHFLCGSAKDIQHLDHYLPHHVHHRWSWWDFDINLKSSEEIFDALEDINNDVLAFFDFLGRLKSPISHKPSRVNERVRYLEEDTGANKYRLGRRKNLPDRYQSEITDRSIEIHQTNPFAYCLRKCMQNVDRWNKPSL